MSQEKQESILILDFGSQFTQLIARRVRELNIYCEIHPYNHLDKALNDMPNIKGIILSGSPFSVHDKDAPTVNLDSIRGKLPILGVCYGAQLMAHQWGGKVGQSSSREYGRAQLTLVAPKNELVHGMSAQSQVWMSHGDSILELPAKAKLLASTEDVEAAAFSFKGEKVYAIQFHPEVYHTVEGTKLLKNFVVDICGCQQNWTADSFIDTTVNELKEKIGNDKVVLGLSGGVDSSVAAVLLHKAIGKNLYCIFVDNGLLRKDEFSSVLESYKHMGLNVKGVDAKQHFYKELAGIEDPKRNARLLAVCL